VFRKSQAHPATQRGRILHANHISTDRAHPAIRVTGLCHAACGEGEHAARQALAYPPRRPYPFASAYTTQPIPPRRHAGCGKKSSRHANAPMRKDSRSTVGCCILSRPLRIEPRHIPATSPFTLINVHQYPGSSVWLPSTPHPDVRRDQPLQLKRPDNHTQTAPRQGLPPAAIKPGPPPPIRPRQTSRVLSPSDTRETTLRIMPPGRRPTVAIVIRACGNAAPVTLAEPACPSALFANVSETPT